MFQEAGIKTDEGKKEPFTELNYILDCLKQRNLEPALEWAQKHREALLAQVSPCELFTPMLQSSEELKKLFFTCRIHRWSSSCTGCVL